MNPLVLLIEDNPDDVLLLRRAFRKVHADVQLKVERDGEAALRYLQDPANPPPTLVLLDLRLPRKSGLEVLAWLRAQVQHALLPVVVLTSSRLDSDVQQAYTLGANSYLVKPVDFNAFQDMVGTLERYWLQLNVNPPTA